MSACGERGGYTGSAESGLSWSMHSHDIDSALTANRIRFYWERGLSLTLEIAVQVHLQKAAGYVAGKGNRVFPRVAAYEGFSAKIVCWR
jgi:hypothetical protein